VSLLLTEGAGKAGCRPHPWPASNKKSWRQSPQVWPNIRPSLRSGFPAYTRSPREPGLFAPVVRIARNVAHLASASGGQDHATSPSASMPIVFGTDTSTASRLTFRDDSAYAPHAEAGRGQNASDLGSESSRLLKNRRRPLRQIGTKANCAWRACRFRKSESVRCGKMADNDGRCLRLPNL
jgi:hypothetical protein